MGNQYAGVAANDRVDGLLDPLLRYGIQRGGGLVEYEDRGVLQKHAGNRQPLLFATGQLEPPVAHHGVQALRLVLHEIPDVGLFQRRLHLGLGGVGLGIQQIIADRAVEQVGLLADHPHLRPQEAQVELAHVDAVEGHTALVHVVQAGNQIDDGALAGAGGPDDGDAVPRLQFKADVLEHGAVLLVAETDVVEHDVALDPVRYNGVRRVVNLHGDVEVVEYP